MDGTFNSRSCKCKFIDYSALFISNYFSFHANTSWRRDASVCMSQLWRVSPQRVMWCDRCDSMGGFLNQNAPDVMVRSLLTIKNIRTQISRWAPYTDGDETKPVSHCLNPRSTAYSRFHNDDNVGRFRIALVYTLCLFVSWWIWTFMVSAWLRLPNCIRSFFFKM